MVPEPKPADPTLEEQLVAYLDGELDAASCRRIEDLLASSPEARRTLQRLEKTWELLDALGAGPTGENFTRTTLEMVALAAEDEVQKQAAKVPQWRRQRWLLGTVVVVVAGALGFLSLAALAPDPNRRLLEDLPLLENLDQYRQVGDVEFLRRLKKEGLFVKEEKNELLFTLGWPSVGIGAEEILQQRRERVERMKPAEKAELARKQEQFEALSREEQDELRRLHDQIEGDPEAEDLRQIMHRYYFWWKKLPAYRRAELSELSQDERVRQIKKWREAEQTRFDPHRLRPQDVQAMEQWAEKLMKRWRQRFWEGLSQEQRERFERINPRWRFLMILSMGGRREPPGAGWPPLLKPNDPEILNDLKVLGASLTPETRKHFDTLTTKKKVETLRHWLRFIFRQQMRSRSGRRPDDERLTEFFEKDLTPEQRDRLLNLPGDEMQSELLRLYLRPSKSAPHPRRRGGGPPGPRHRENGPSGPPHFPPPSRHHRSEDRLPP